MSIENRLEQLGHSLPSPPKPVAAYAPAVFSKGMVIVSGQLPMKNGELMSSGKVPSQVTLEEARSAACQCTLNALAILKAELGGDLDRLVRVVRVGVFVHCEDGFSDHPQVANGASEFLLELLGEPGRHARAAVGTNSLPLNAPVEVEFTFEVN